MVKVADRAMNKKGREETKNREIWKVPINQKLTATLESAKKVSKSEYVFSDNGKPYGDIKSGWWSSLKSRDGRF